MIFKTKRLAQANANKRKRQFKSLINKNNDASRNKFLRESIKTVKVRKMYGSPTRYIVEGR